MVIDQRKLSKYVYLTRFVFKSSEQLQVLVDDPRFNKTPYVLNKILNQLNAKILGMGGQKRYSYRNVSYIFWPVNVEVSIDREKGGIGFKRKR